MIDERIKNSAPGTVLFRDARGYNTVEKSLKSFRRDLD